MKSTNSLHMQHSPMSARSSFAMSLLGVQSSIALEKGGEADLDVWIGD